MCFKSNKGSNDMSLIMRPLKNQDSVSTQIRILFVANNMLCGDKATIWQSFCHIDWSSHCVCVDNQTAVHNQNILWSQVQYTTQSNQISLTHNNNRAGPQNQHCCGGESDKMWHVHSNWIVISQISFDGVHNSTKWLPMMKGAKENGNLCPNIRYMLLWNIR